MRWVRENGKTGKGRESSRKLLTIIFSLHWHHHSYYLHFFKTKSAIKLVTRPIPIKTKNCSDIEECFLDFLAQSRTSLLSKHLFPRQWLAKVTAIPKNQFLNIATYVINDVMKDLGVARNMASPDWWRWSRLACVRAQSVLSRDCTGSTHIKYLLHKRHEMWFFVAYLSLLLHLPILRGPTLYLPPEYQSSRQCCPVRASQ